MHLWPWMSPCGNLLPLEWLCSCATVRFPAQAVGRQEQSMTTTPIPDDVRRYILAAVPSVPYLEALLLLRADASRAWEPATVAHRLYVTEADAAAVLRALGDAGVATLRGDAWIYAPADDDLRGLLDSVAQTYSTHLVAVTEIIHSRLERRARQFADAFRWKKEER